MKRLLSVSLLIATLIFFGTNAVDAKPGKANGNGASNSNAGGNGGGNAGGNGGGNSGGGGDRAGGDAGGNAGGNRPSLTEDNDSDGVPNNIADDGDNRHPSGRDRSVESGNSGNQGNSQSDPDGMTNGGADKPGGTGGIDQLDQDGNNGCGNDDDFEDDNNGNCGGKEKSTSPVADDIIDSPDAVEAPTDAAATPETRRLLTPNGQLPQILSVNERVDFIEAYDGPVEETEDASVLSTVSRNATEVLGAVREAGTGTLSTMNGLLPRTGAGIAVFVIAALSLLGAGLSATRYAKRRRAMDEVTSGEESKELLAA
jgi:hypothetical protein